MLPLEAKIRQSLDRFNRASVIDKIGSAERLLGDFVHAVIDLEKIVYQVAKQNSQLQQMIEDKNHELIETNNRLS